MEYRNELKFLVTEQDLALLRFRLLPVMAYDVHQDGDCYSIRSLYFDDMENSCMRENEAGVDDRRKYRIRIYKKSSEKISMEIKEKFRGFTKKRSCLISREECERYMAGQCPVFRGDMERVAKEFYAAHAARGMRPVSIVEYERTAFTERVGNVRVTFDRNIGVSDRTKDFFSESLPLTPVLPAGLHILEVKYDEFLPDYIAGLLEIGSLRRTSFSKYYLSRINAIQNLV